MFGNVAFDEADVGVDGTHNIVDDRGREASEDWKDSTLLISGNMESDSPHVVLGRLADYTHRVDSLGRTLTS
jgi:hypothetical protein